MQIDALKLVYFSPTKTTKKVLEGIAHGLKVDKVEHIDLTAPESATMDLREFIDEFVIIGAPVYAGRVPPDAINRLKLVKAKNTAAVLVVVYGNRAYEDALLELKDLSIQLGYTPVAGAAFIGEHSFSTETMPIANGRPDMEDLKKAEEFGMMIHKKMSDIRSLDAIYPLQVTGNSPYIDHGILPMEAPITLASLCKTCGTCAAVCPKAAIEVEDLVFTDSNACIRCCACVKDCPTGARIMESETVQEIAEWLSKNFSERKEPEIFV